MQRLETQLPTTYQQFIHLAHYARFDDNLGRRETWEETVYRYVTYIKGQAAKFGWKMEETLEMEIYKAILNLEVMPSMRALMTAGPALERDNSAGFNCAALTLSSIKAFGEILYLSACGCGVGFSVERQFINKLPELPAALYPVSRVIQVEDNRIGWAEALTLLLTDLYAGHLPKWDLSKLRPAGARLKTFGGRASGPGPLDELLRHVVAIFQEAISSHQTKLNSLQCHSIACKIGDAIVAGGARRSALCSLSNPSDDRMRNAKSGNWWETDPHFAMANNSAVWTEKPSPEIFLDEWISLIKSRSGERGIFNRVACNNKIKNEGRRVQGFDWLTNPCF